jgi:hypothetical protein
VQARRPIFFWLGLLYNFTSIAATVAAMFFMFLNTETVGDYVFDYAALLVLYHFDDEILNHQVMFVFFVSTAVSYMLKQHCT